MISTIPELRGLQGELALATWTLAALGALYESKVFEQLREPRSADELAARCPTMTKSRIERCLAVAATAGLVAVEGGRYKIAETLGGAMNPGMIGAIAGDVRAQLMQAAALLDSASGAAPKEGWNHVNPALLQAQGDASSAFVPIFKGNIVGSMGDLAARLEKPEARFLDVGVGVASLAIGMCRAFPQLRVVGLDTSDAPLAIARKNVAAAGLGDRVELRKLGVDALDDESAFDLAWLPTFFIAPAVLPQAIARVRASLRPGGWILCPVMGGIGSERQRAVWALLMDTWGGPGLGADETDRLLKDAGFATTRVHQGPPNAPGMVMAQRS
jgi:SAM-dependent methyltransferase